MKSAVEKRFEELSEKYHKKFKKNFPLLITGSMSLEEACKRIEKCLKSGKEEKPLKYKKDADY